MRKLLPASALLLLIACQPLAEDDQAIVNKAIEAAVKTQDYRLIARSTRGLDIPTVEPSERQAIKAQCGIKYLPEYGDVIKDKDKFYQLANYAKAFNEKMLPICLEQATAK